MASRPTLKRPESEAEETKPVGQQRPREERYVLRVDGQPKRSFASKEEAITAGEAIKKSYAVVIVTVVDTKEGSHEQITG
jgi:hypothetical protein